MSPAADGNVFTDLSGTSNSTTGNPYDALLEACKQEPVPYNPSWAPHMAEKLIYPRKKSSFAIRRTARLAMVNKKASSCLRSFQDSSSTKCCTSSSTQRQIQDMPIRGIAWSSGRDRHYASGGLWTLCRSGYLNTHQVSSPLRSNCLLA